MHLNYNIRTKLEQQLFSEDTSEVKDRWDRFIDGMIHSKVIDDLWTNVEFRKAYSTAAQIQWWFDRLDRGDSFEKISPMGGFDSPQNKVIERIFENEVVNCDCSYKLMLEAAEKTLQEEYKDLEDSGEGVQDWYRQQGQNLQEDIKLFLMIAEMVREMKDIEDRFVKKIKVEESEVE